MPEPVKPVCMIGGFDICIQKNSVRGGDKLCDYCKDIHPHTMYRKLYRKRYYSNRRSFPFTEKRCEEIVAEMWKDQRSRVEAGKHLCVFRQRRFRSGDDESSWVVEIEEIRSRHKRRQDEMLRVKDYLVCEAVAGEAELCSNCLGDLEGVHTDWNVKVFSEDGKYLTHEFVEEGRE
jgi:hypothetical protein